MPAGKAASGSRRSCAAHRRVAGPPSLFGREAAEACTPEAGATRRPWCRALRPRRPREPSLAADRRPGIRSDLESGPRGAEEAGGW